MPLKFNAAKFKRYCFYKNSHTYVDTTERCTYIYAFVFGRIAYIKLDSKNIYKIKGSEFYFNVRAGIIAWVTFYDCPGFVNKCRVFRSNIL